MLLHKFKIAGHSMEPTLKFGDNILVSSLPYFITSPQEGDIVAVKIDERILIKRITKVEQQKYFLSGDNHEDSFDSRKFGMIARKDILGKVVHVI